MDPEVDFFSVLHLRDFLLQARDRRRGRGLLRLQLRWIEHGNQIPGLHRCAFIHQQFLDASFHLRADDDLIGVHCSDQHEIREWSVEKIVVDRGDHKNDAEKNKETVASTHERAPCGRDIWGRNSAAEIKSSTAARRSAMRCGVRGLKPTILCIIGALLK